MRIALSFIFICIGNYIFAQNSDVITGKIYNAETNEVVEFANIGIEDTYLGAASNFEGVFTLNVSPALSNHTVRVSAVGFQSKTFRLSDWMQSENLTIHLTPVNYGLSAVDVKADSKIAYGIIRTAYNLIEDNYPQKAFTSEYVYITDRQNDSLFVILNDKDGYRNRSYSQVYLSRNYKFVNQSDAYVPLSEGMTKMDQLLSGDIVRTTGNVLSTTTLNDFDMNVKSEDDLTYTISYKCLSPNISNTGCVNVNSYEGEIVISKCDHAILQNSLKVTQKGFSEHGNHFPNISSNTEDYVFELKADYKKDEHYYHLEKVKYSDNHREINLLFRRALDFDATITTHQYYTAKSH